MVAVRATGAGSASTSGAGAAGEADVAASRPGAIPPGRIGTVTSDPLAVEAAGALLCTVTGAAGAGIAAVGAGAETGAETGAVVSTGGGVTVTGAASCAKDGVEDKASTAAIAVRPGRTGDCAYLMQDQSATRLRVSIESDESMDTADDLRNFSN